MTVDDYFSGTKVDTTDLPAMLRRAADDAWKVPVSVSSELMLRAADAIEGDR